MEINHEITSILDLDLLLEKIAEITRRFIPFQVFAILLLDESTDELYYRFSVGHPKDVVDGFRVPVGHGIIGTAAREMRPVRVDDVSSDSRYIRVVEGTRSELAVPLISRGSVLGVLNIESPVLGFFREEQGRMLHLLASQIAIAIENATLYESEKRSRELLTLLYDVSLEIASTLDVDELINKIAETVKSAVDYDIFTIFLLDETSAELTPRMVFRGKSQAREKFNIPVGKGLVGFAALRNQPVRVGDVRQDARYIDAHGETRSEIVIPLAYKGAVIGALDLESPEADHFTEYDERLLMTLATRIASAILNAELYERVAQNERRLDSELIIAREVQRQLLPDEIPEMRGLELAVSITPVAHLGGDLYDVLRIEDGRFAILVGDVSGKGAPAALYSALVSGVMRTRTTRKLPPAETLASVNQSLQQRKIGSHYVALLFAVYDPGQMNLTFSNSGLPYPIRVGRNGADFLDLPGVPLGLLRDSTYQERSIPLETGDVIVVYTDGVIESRAPNGEEFGLKRLAELIEQQQAKDPSEIITAIQTELVRYRQVRAADDDQTLLVMKVNAL